MKSVYFINVFLLMFMAFTYLVSLTYLMQYLERSYTRTWTQLGRPEFSSNWVRNNPLEFSRSFLKLLQFAFSDQHASFNDRQLSNLVWLVRGSLVFGVALFIVQLTIGFDLR